jgi:hypothetical protein
LNFSKKYLLLVEISVFCSNIEILDYRELSIIFATKIDNSITQNMAKISIIDNDKFRYINTRYVGAGQTKTTCQYGKKKYDSNIEHYWDVELSNFECVQPVGMVIGGISKDHE